MTDLSGPEYDPTKSGPYQDGEPLAKVARSAIADESELRAKTAAELAEEARQARMTARELTQQAKLAAQREEAASRPQEPDIVGMGECAIVSFTKYQSGREYHYAAVGWRASPRSAPRWAISGSTTDRLNWSGLLAFIGRANWGSLYLMSESELLGPLPGSEPPTREVMGPYGRVLRSEAVALAMDADYDYVRNFGYPDF